MNKRQQLIRKNKNAEKNLIKREQNYAYKFFIFFMVAGILNWIFWHEQFIGLDLKHTVVFVVLPLIVGLLVYLQMNKSFVRSILKSKSSGLADTFLSNIFLLVTALFFAYLCSCTIADAIFKLSMDFCIEDKPSMHKTYVVESTVRNDSRRGVCLFSTIYIMMEQMKSNRFMLG